MMASASRDKARARFEREFRRLTEHNPRIARTLNRVSHRRWRPVRVPLALLLIAGSFLAILPVLGLWMLPAGLVLLAIDIPRLQRPVGRLMVWFRVRMRRFGRRRD